MVHKRVWTLAWHATALIGVTITIAPFLWMLSSSLKESGALFAYPPIIIPRQPVWGNFVAVFDVIPFWRYIGNTTFIAGLSAIGQIFCCTTAGFAFARLYFPGKQVVFWALIGALLIPPQVTLVPTFLMVNAIGWLDTYYPIILPWCLAGAIGTFLARQFYKTVPQEIDDAALIDGCGSLRLFWNIYLPLSGPIIATIVVLTLVAQWNNLITPLIYLSTQAKYPISLGLASLVTQYSARWNILMATNLMSILPVVVAFFAAQRYFVSGMLTSGLK